VDEWGLWRWLNGSRYNGIATEGLAMDETTCELCDGTKWMTVTDYPVNGGEIQHQIPCPRCQDDEQ
jgi:hypothetical protein